MKNIQELIILHIQEIYMNKISVPKVRTTMLKTVNDLVDKTITDGNISFWLDFPESGGKSAIEIKKLPNVKSYEAPSGSAINYTLNTNEVTFTGLWIGACVSYGIISLVKAYIENTKLHKKGKLTINLESNGICKPNKLLSEMHAGPLEDSCLAGFTYDTTKAYFEQHELIQERGLAVNLIRKHKDPKEEIAKTITYVQSTNPSSPMFLIVLNVV